MKDQGQRRILSNQPPLCRRACFGVGPLEVFECIRKRRRGLRASKLMQQTGEFCGRRRLRQRACQTAAAVAGEPETMASAAAARRISTTAASPRASVNIN